MRRWAFQPARRNNLESDVGHPWWPPSKHTDSSKFQFRATGEYFNIGLTHPASWFCFSRRHALMIMIRKTMRSLMEKQKELCKRFYQWLSHRGKRRISELWHLLWYRRQECFQPDFGMETPPRSGPLYSEISSSADGMHEAILDIVKSMTDLKNYLFWF